MWFKWHSYRPDCIGFKAQNKHFRNCATRGLFAIYCFWYLNCGETNRRRHDAVHPYAIKNRGHRRLPCFVKKNWSRSVVQLTAHYIAGRSRNVSENTVQQTELDMRLRIRRLSYASTDQASSPTTSMLGPWTLRLDHGSVEESCKVRWFTVCHSSRQWPCQDAPSSRRTIAPSMRSKWYTERWWR